MYDTAVTNKFRKSSITERVKKTGENLAGFFMSLKRDGAGSFISPRLGQRELSREAKECGFIAITRCEKRANGQTIRVPV